MKIRSSALILLILGVIYYGMNYSTADQKEKESVIFDSVIKVMDYAHFSPKNLDDDFSNQAFDEFFTNLDYGKRFLTKKDIKTLEKYRYTLDDAAKNSDITFFNEAMEIYNSAFDKSKVYYKKIINSDFDINKIEEYELDAEKRDFAEDDTELENRWRKNLKYDFIQKVSNLQEKEAAKAEDEPKLSEAEILVKAKEETKELFDDYFDRLERMRRSDRFETFVNTYTQLFDPHTTYLNPKEKEDFDINIGGKLEGIGARLQQDGDYTKVSSIVVGGPAWKGKELAEGDQILKVRQGGDEEAIDIFGWRIDDVVQKIRGKKGTIVFLTVKREDGTQSEIRIERDEVVIDDSFARSFMIDVPDVLDNVGYIKLPKFYSTFDGPNGNSCSDDVKKEMEKLKSEGAQAMILDLRNNGGGSLSEVVTMSGLYIEKGPIVQVKPKNRNPSVYKDRDADVTWDGPLVVMVNEYSASASEILAAALQDYDRAVIVGSPTYGKGTVQRFYDLDDITTGNGDYKPLGNVKLTMQKFFRINGGSTQLRGVTPDILLPDRYTEIETGEKEYKNAMAWTQIDPVEYNQNVYKIKDKEKLAQKSAERIKTNDEFKLIAENAMYIKKEQENSIVPLNLKAYNEDVERKESEVEKFKNIMKDSLETLVVRNLKSDQEYLDVDESRRARNNEQKSSLFKDIYVEETVHVLKDLIDQQKGIVKIQE